MFDEMAALSVPMIIFGVCDLIAGLYVWVTDELPARRKAKIEARHRGAERYKITFTGRD